jgi:hypothetical protein
MRVLAILLVPLLLTTLTACRIGSNAAKSPVADSPYGAQAYLELTASGEADIRAELLAVTEKGLLLDDGAHIHLFLFSSFEKTTLSGAPGSGTLKGEDPDPERLEAFRKYSRYPFGLTDEQLAYLLETREQEELIVHS